MASYTHKMTALPPQYDTAVIEKKWQEYWLKNKTFAWNPKAARQESYVIDTPPPTVSGHLHMGHVFSYTQADFVARYQRMQGMNVFYPMGFDDNGLPTERLVEKSKKIRAADVGREKFIEICNEVAEEARRDFRALFQSIALSVDWAQEYSTISADCRRLSQLSFLDLVKKEQVYRKLQPMLWDPVDQTAIAQAEVVDKELPSHFTDIAFKCAHTGEELVIGTTRPELLGACVALFFHPEDERYQKHKGHEAIVPLFGYKVPILTDESVEKDKGTGLMMCCTFGDEEDIKKWQQYHLATYVILNKYAKIDFGDRAENLPAALVEKLKNKKISNTDKNNPGARELMLEELKAAGLIRKQEAITHAVKCAERSGAVLELIPTHQWFVKVLDKKEALKKKAATSTWHPEWMKVRMDQWIDGLNWDWCISRQRYFGVPFPVWYGYFLSTMPDGRKMTGSKGPIYARPADLPINPLNAVPSEFKIISRETAVFVCEAVTDYICPQSGEKIFSKGDTALLEPDYDVMDTWATSSISPQLSAHGISSDTAADKDRFSKLYPADLRPQAHEIIRTWAFYTLVKSHLHNKQIPWHNLMISGWCLAEDKTKMSKSKGNVVTPVALIEEKGTDAVRYWAGTSRLGMDTAFSPDLLKIGKKLVGKLWNATQFAAIHLDKMSDAPSTPATDKAITETLDRWILHRLAEVVREATDSFDGYEYANALNATNEFFWADFCDNYLELIKKRVYNEDGIFTSAQQQSAVRALYYCLETILKLYAPFVPHVTEELYSHIFADAYAKSGSLHAKSQWPSKHDFREFDAVLRDNPDDPTHLAAEDAVKLLEMVRSYKSEKNISIKFPIAKLKVSPQTPRAKESLVRLIESDLKGAGNIIALEWVDTPLNNEAASDYAIEVELADAADAA